MSEAADRINRLQNLIQDRILVLDGAMGTMIQALNLDEAAVRSDRFAACVTDLPRPIGAFSRSSSLQEKFPVCG